MTAPLMQEVEYYKTVREDLAKEQAGEFVAIKGRQILGIYFDYMQAARALYPQHKQGSVFIQQIKSGKDGHVGIIHTPGLVALK